MSLAALAQFAVSNNNSRAAARTPLHELSIEDARAKVTVKNGNKKDNGDGSQALTLTLGKHRLSLEAVAPGATRINATAEQIDEFSAVLLAAVAAGEFDNTIVEAQAKANPANRPVKKVVEASGESVETAPEGVDLDALEGTDSLFDNEIV